MKNNTITNRVRKLLMKLGIDPALLGYKFLVDAVERVYTDREYIEQMTKKLYPAIAAAHRTTNSKVERAMRHAIERITDINPDAYELFPAPPANGAAKYTNSQFVAYCAEILRMEDDEDA